jgi:hypothetical protein
MATLVPSINGYAFSTFGIIVSNYGGILGELQRKEVITRNWNDYHGEQVNLTSNPVYQPRDIVLDCAIQGATTIDFHTQLDNFKAEFRKVGTQRFSIDYMSGKQLAYEVYLRESFEVNKRFSETNMIGTFSVRLREPEPVKRIITFSGTGNKTIEIATDYPLNIYWGDGTSSKSVRGDITHNYSISGTHVVIITGMIDEITSMTYTGGTLIWSKLQ